MISTKIRTEYITLGQLVKYLGLINNGCEEKSFILNNTILYNGVKENRRGKKIYPHDKVVINDKEYLIEKE